MVTVSMGSTSGYVEWDRDSDTWTTAQNDSLEWLVKIWMTYFHGRRSSILAATTVTQPRRQ